MSFNASKCSILHFGFNNPGHEYTMYGAVLDSSQEEKDVGILISDDRKPSGHVRKAANMANKVLGLMARSYHYRDKIT